MGQSAEIRVMVVDDNAAFRESLIRFVAELQGFAVVGSASRGEQALGMASRLHPGVVLVDLRMAWFDGLELVRDLKRLPGEPVVVVVSSLPETRFRQNALAAGADAFLLKEKVASELEAILRAACQSHPPPPPDDDVTAVLPAGVCRGCGLAQDPTREICLRCLRRLGGAE